MGIKQRRTDSDVIQPRAIATRQKILDSALKLYASQGYHNTTVDQIAKNVGLSVGVAYRYFKNKKDILLAALEYAFSNIENLSGTDSRDVFNGNLSQSLSAFEKIHTDFHDLHEELEGLRHTDEDVRTLYDNVTQTAIKRMHETLPDELRNRPGSLVDLYIAVGIMENYCHLYMNRSLGEKEIKLMRDKTLKLVQELLV